MDDARRAKPAPLTEAELAELRKRRAATKASLACEGMYLTDEEEALFDQLDAERLSPDECISRIIDYCSVREAEDAARRG